jgi:hypothetical protein
MIKIRYEAYADWMAYEYAVYSGNLRKYNRYTECSDKSTAFFGAL